MKKRIGNCISQTGIERAGDISNTIPTYLRAVNPKSMRPLTIPVYPTLA